MIMQFIDLNDRSKGDYQILKQNLDNVKSIYCKKFYITQVNVGYYLSAIIYMDGPLYYTIILYKIENEEKLILHYLIPYILMFEKIEVLYLFNKNKNLY